MYNSNLSWIFLISHIYDNGDGCLWDFVLSAQKDPERIYDLKPGQLLEAQPGWHTNPIAAGKSVADIEMLWKDLENGEDSCVEGKKEIRKVKWRWRTQQQQRSSEKFGFNGHINAYVYSHLVAQIVSAVCVHSDYIFLWFMLWTKNLYIHNGTVTWMQGNESPSVCICMSQKQLICSTSHFASVTCNQRFLRRGIVMCMWQVQAITFAGKYWKLHP